MQVKVGLADGSSMIVSLEIVCTRSAEIELAQQMVSRLEKSGADPVVLDVKIIEAFEPLIGAPSHTMFKGPVEIRLEQKPSGTTVQQQPVERHQWYDTKDVRRAIEVLKGYSIIGEDGRVALEILEDFVGKLEPKPQQDKYGRCPFCKSAVVSREQREHGNDTCAWGHVYPSSSTLKIKG